MGKVVSKYGTPKTAGEVGAELSKSTEFAKGEFWSSAVGKYKEAKAALKGELGGAGPQKEYLVDTKNLYSKMDDILKYEKSLNEDIQDTAIIKYIESLKRHSPEKIDPIVLLENQKRLNGINFKNSSYARDIKGWIDEAWDEYGDKVLDNVLEKITGARGFYKAGMEEFIENPIVNRILTQQGMMGSIPYQKIITTIFKPEYTAQLKNMQKYLSPEAFDQAKRGFISNFFDIDSPLGAKILKAEGGFADVIDGKELLRNIQKNKKIFEEFFDEGTYQAMVKLGELAKSSFAGAKILGQKEWSGMIGQTIRVTGLMGLASQNIEGAIASLPAGATMAWLLSSNHSPLKRMLLSNVTIPTGTRRVLEIGGKAAIQNIGREMIE
jgi:hypothetical protein